MREFEQAQQAAIKLSGTLDVAACNPSGSNELVLVVRNYGGKGGISVAFDTRRGAKCWTTVDTATPYTLNGEAPRRHESYGRLEIGEETFYPYSIDVGRLPGRWMEDGWEMEKVCKDLYYHMRGKWPDERS